MEYSAKYKPNQLIYGDSNSDTVIISGWTISKNVAGKIPKTDYAAIGQLYSPTRGISFLLRNLFLNPHIKHLIGLKATKEDLNAGSVQCLSDFFSHGYEKGLSDSGQKCWVINSQIKGYIDIEIDRFYLDWIRKAINYIEVTSISKCLIELEKLKNFDLSSLGYGRVAKEFPMVENIPQVMPGVLYGHRIEGKTIAETWVKIIHRIKTTGTIRATGYDGNWQELINVMAVVTNEPENFYFPEPNYLPVDKHFIESYLPQVLDDAPYREGVKYTYGQRLRSHFGHDQIEQVISKLIGEIDAASAVMSLWDVEDHVKGGSPCLNHIWLRIVNNSLSMTATFRSNDMFSAWVANAMGLRALQKHICTQINVRSQNNLKLGELITISQSAHIYDDSWENADLLIKHQYTEIANSRDYFDPSGNYLIEVEDQKIIVIHTTPGSGEKMRTYRGKNPLKLLREICMDSPAIQPEHSGYLGIELQKACNCILTNTKYNQDI
jgi:thymidylate synthase